MEWHTLTLSDIATVKSGSGFPKKYQGLPNESYPFYKVSDMNLTGNEESLYFENNTISSQIRGVLKATLFPVGSIVFPKVGAAIATNKKRILTKVGCVDNNVMGVIPKKDKIDSRFLYFWFQQHNLSEFANEAALPSIKKTTVEEWPVKLPICKIEQKRIVSILDQAFADLEQVRAKTEQNLKNARELFDSYLEQVFSPKGEGWVACKMTDICEIKTKLIDPKKDDYLELLHIGAGNIVSNTGELIKLQTAKEEGLVSGKFVFDSSMILYSKIRPYLRKVCRPKFTGVCSADIYPLSPITETIDKNFLFYLLLSKDFTDYAISGSGRAGMPKVNRTHLFNYSVLIPPIDRQREFVIKINQVANQSQDLENIYNKKLDSIDELKKSILQKAFSGELTAT
jgi:type I restriction enzyme S subunit